nr:hypothetical protein [Nocardia cyriacigeorgica]
MTALLASDLVIGPVTTARRASATVSTARTLAVPPESAGIGVLAAVTKSSRSRRCACGAPRTDHMVTSGSSGPICADTDRARSDRSAPSGLPSWIPSSSSQSSQPSAASPKPWLCQR